MTRPRAADDFATIRARMEELRREREGGQAREGQLTAEPAVAPRPKSALAAVRDWRSAGKGPPIRPNAQSE